MNPSRSCINKALKLLRSSGWECIRKEQYCSEMDSEFLSIWQEVQKFTMISIERAWALAEALRYICRADIPGDIVECGVWKGGACLLASHILHRENCRDKRIWLYDTFSGMPSPGREDRIASSGQSLEERRPEGWWSAGRDEVRSTLFQSPLPAERFEWVEGRVELTLGEHIPEQTSLIRLDTDWYESTRAELSALYPGLSAGGVLIIDDYGHFSGAKKAVDEFFAESGIVPLLHRSDYTGRVFVKPVL